MMNRSLCLCLCLLAIGCTKTTPMNEFYYKGVHMIGFKNVPIGEVGPPLERPIRVGDFVYVHMLNPTTFERGGRVTLPGSSTDHAMVERINNGDYYLTWQDKDDEKINYHNCVMEKMLSLAFDDPGL